MLFQAAVNTIALASVYLLVAVSFAMIFSVTRFFNFGHGAVVTGAAYATLLFKSWLEFSPVVSVCLGIAAAVLLGCLMEMCLYRPLRQRHSSTLILMLASLGLYVVIQHGISLVFDDYTKTIRSGVVQEGFGLLGARITGVQILTSVAALVVCAGISALLRQTRLGVAMRAVADDPELARVSGVHSDRVILCVFAIGSALAGLAGILIALDVDMTPTMGMNALLMGIVTVIVGGIRSIPGLAIGAMILGASQNLGVLIIGAEWQNAVAFAVLLAFLLFKPQGVMGRSTKGGAV
jgi:branched-chain amino acid transport system permease protein